MLARPPHSLFNSRLFPALLGILLTTTVLSGCEHSQEREHNNERQLAAGRGTSKITPLGDNSYNVFCPTGICRFQLKNNGSADIKFHFYYSAGQPFRALEGIYLNSLAGDQDVSESMTVLDNTTSVQLNLNAGEHHVEIQAVDYHR
ncbi:Uncharacterised protein [BD1-7 clade bacterium]|uniref:Uncharacterized protein n=1 Tax=BD1-7 clade bacterium TaxID=2029982 RepID=A0A5S9PAX4_9GAMM|nr:Uncharacterised protein [BD1-7 clade bacterium]